MLGYEVIVNGIDEQGLLLEWCLAIDGQQRPLMPSSSAPPPPLQGAACAGTRGITATQNSAIFQAAASPEVQRAEVARAGTAACLRT